MTNFMHVVCIQRLQTMVNKMGVVFCMLTSNPPFKILRMGLVSSAQKQEASEMTNF